MSSFFSYLRAHWVPVLIIVVLVVAWAKDNYSDSVVTMEGKGGGDFVVEDSLMSYGERENFAQTKSQSYDDVAMAPERSVDLDVEQKVIQTGSLSLHVEDVQSVMVEIEGAVEAWGGHVLNTNVTRGESSYSGYLTVRVPSDRFETAMDGLKELSLYVVSEYSNASDVTETYIDLQARLENYKAEEVQYQSILDRAVTVEEVLQVTQALSTVRYQIESLETQLAYYDNRIDESTIDVYLTEDESVSAVADTWRPVGTFKEALSNWVVFLQDVVDAAIYTLIYAWPVLLLGLVWMVWKRGRKNHKTR